MPWFGHRARCSRGNVHPRERSALWLVCRTCMPELVLSCGMCGALAPALGEHEGFDARAWGNLCGTCVRAVQDAGPSRRRRAEAVAAREEVVLRAYPSLVVDERARRRVTIGGVLAGRRVRLTLRHAAREGEDERYVLRLETFSTRERIEKTDLRLLASLVDRLSRGSPSLVTDGFRQVRIAFLHLGRRDLLHAIEGLLETVVGLES